MHSASPDDRHDAGSTTPAAVATTAHYDGLSAAALAERLQLPHVALFDATTSTMDEADALASSGAPAGTMVLANVQTAGRGRSGARWVAREGSSVLCTIIERPPTADGIPVLSLRVGLLAAQALDSFAGTHVKVKWPNDLYVTGGKIAGILVEARWRNAHPEWVCVAMGVNIGLPPQEAPDAAGLPGGVSRLEVLGAIVPAMRTAAARIGVLSDAELTQWSERDWLAGRSVSAPVPGVVAGVLASGELVVHTQSGAELVRSGNVVLAQRSS